MKDLTQETFLVRWYSPTIFRRVDNMIADGEKILHIIYGYSHLKHFRSSSLSDKDIEYSKTC